VAFRAKGELKRVLGLVERKGLHMLMLMMWPTPLMLLSLLPPLSANRLARETAPNVCMVLIMGWTMFITWRWRREPLGVDPLRFLCEETLVPEEIARLDRHVRSRHKRLWSQYRRPTYIASVMLVFFLYGLAALGVFWVVPFLHRSHPWATFPGLQVLTCAIVFLLFMPFFSNLNAEAALVEWREAGLDVKGIVARIRQRFFPGRTWFERQG
jgi:hypothetical protein